MFILTSNSFQIRLLQADRQAGCDGDQVLMSSNFTSVRRLSTIRRCVFHSVEKLIHKWPEIGLSNPFRGGNELGVFQLKFRKRLGGTEDRKCEPRVGFYE
jgi:hypothetical protein